MVVFFPPRAAALGSSARVSIHLGSGCGLGQGEILEGSERNLEPRYFSAVVKGPKSSRRVPRWVPKGSRRTEGIRKVPVVMPPHC